MAGKHQGPLKGVRVLDLTGVVAGPYATQIFADLGADVIKVEPPEGDTIRRLPPGPDPTRGAMFMNLNRGKRSLVLDLKRPEARDALLRVAATCDVFIHSMRAAAIARLGLAYDAVRAASPRIVYANLWGFGQAGPYRDLPAYDDIIQAASGLVALQGKLAGGEPTYLATIVADKVAGLTAAYAVAAALYAREKTGEGQEIEVPMFETMVSFTMTEHLNGALFDPALGPPEYPRITSPNRRPYRTADGHLAVLIYSDKHWTAFFRALGDPDWSRDPMFADVRARTENIGAVLARVAEILLTRPTTAWVSLFRDLGIPAMPIASPADLLDDEHLEAAGFWERRDTPEGTLRFPGVPTRFGGTPGAVGDAGPELARDSREVLAEAGLTDSEADALL